MTQPASDVAAIVGHTQRVLDFTTLTTEAVWYQHLPVCVVDTVFSIGARYTSTRNTVEQFCAALQIVPTGSAICPPQSEQFSLTQFLNLYEAASPDILAATLYKNRQRTSSRFGILKAEAAHQFGAVLLRHGVDYLQDVDSIVGKAAFEEDIKQIPGQRSGISLRYFYILTGSQNHVKPDRMVLRFIHQAIGREVGVEQAELLIREAAALLQRDYPALTPALLDNLIWRYQQTQPARSAS